MVATVLIKHLNLGSVTEEMKFKILFNLNYFKLELPHVASGYHAGQSWSIMTQVGW